MNFIQPIVTKEEVECCAEPHTENRLYQSTLGDIYIYREREGTTLQIGRS